MSTPMEGKANRKSDDLDCCVPDPTCSYLYPLQLYEAVRVICTNSECSQSGFMHQQCFVAWEETVLNYIKCRGRARSWTDAQRRGNLWSGKGYPLAYKSCNCLCGHGCLKKDLDWKPPAAPNLGKSDNLVDKKKKKRDKTNLRPKLNYNAREACSKKDIELMSDDMGQVKMESNVNPARAVDSKIEIVSFPYDTKEDDGWGEETLHRSTGIVVKWNTDGSDLGRGFIRDSHYSNRWIRAYAINFEETSNIDFESIVGEEVEYMLKKMGHNRYEATKICQKKNSLPFQCFKTDDGKHETQTSHTSTPHEKPHVKLPIVENRPLKFIEIEQSGIISLWCPITNYGTITRSDGVKFMAYLNSFSQNQKIDKTNLVGCFVTFSFPDNIAAQNIVILENNVKSNDKYNKIYSGAIVYWNSGQGYGFVRSPDIDERVFLFLGSFNSKVDVNYLFGRNIQFQLKQHENQDLQNVVVNASITDTEYQIRSRIRTVSEPILVKKRPQAEKSSSSVDCQSISRFSPLTPQLISLYRFFGTVVTYKPVEAYGFIRSSQVTGDIFFNVSDFPGLEEKFCELTGTNIYFVMYDVGKKSMEARNITFAEKLDKESKSRGIVTKWDHTGSGFIKLDMEFCSEQVILSYRELRCESNLIKSGVEVQFTLFLNYDGLLEARDVHSIDQIALPASKGKYRLPSVIPPRFAAAKAKVAAQRNVCSEEIVHPKDKEELICTQNTIELERLTDQEKLFERLTDKINGRDFIKSVSVMNEEKLVETFGQLKTSLSHLAFNATGSQIVAALLKRSAGIGSPVENKIIRMLASEFCSLVENKHGCLVLEAALKFSSNNHKGMLVEKMLEFDYQQFSKFWIHGCSVFVCALQQLDQDQEEILVSILASHCGSMATYSKNHGALRSLILEIKDKPCIEELAIELEPILLELADHKYGWLIVEALAQSSRENVKEMINNLCAGRIKKLAANDVSSKVVETAVRHGTNHQQQCWIEEVCSMNANQAEKPVLWLAKHQHGYKVVLAMLQVSTNKQIHGDLKASILFKQEDLLQSQYGKKVLQMIKIEQ